MKKTLFLVALLAFHTPYVWAQTADLAGAISGNTFESSVPEKTEE